MATANGTFRIGTGAGFSAVSESEAARLGLRFAKSMGSVNTSTTQTAAYRVAIAKELIIGGFCLRDVTFGVFPNDGDPWRNLAPGRRGLIGFPVQTVLRRMSWSRDGTFAVGRSGDEPRTAEPNLALFDDHPGVRVAIAEREVLFTLDTGAVNTDLYARFGQEFPGVMGTAKKTESEVRGIAGAEIHGAFELTELKIVVGGTPATLRPAIVLAQQINSPRFVGNLGFDVLKQHGTFFVDFETMRVEIAGFGDK